MTTIRRTQADRTATTRRALVQAGRRLFTDPGYAAVGTERIAHEAGVTRGALYHHFGDKVELFAAVMETLELELTVRLARALPDDAADDPVAVLVAGADAWLAAATEPEMQRIVLVDGPAVLGWERWREIGMRHGLGLVAAILEQAMASGAIPVQPVEPLAQVLVGALDEAALYVARAADPATARVEVGPVVRRLVDGLVGRT